MDRSRTVLVAVACALVALVSGLYLGGHPSALPDWARKAFVANDNAVRDQLIDAIRDGYYKKVDTGRLEQASLKGVVQELHDPFSHYLTPAEAKLFRQSLDPAFEGVGMSVRDDKRGLRIAKVFKNSPADRAGIRTDDLIVAVDGKPVRTLP
jgi:carboxyl-terminal processing protease